MNLDRIEDDRPSPELSRFEALRVAHREWVLAGVALSDLGVVLDAEGGVVSDAFQHLLDAYDDFGSVLARGLGAAPDDQF